MNITNIKIILLFILSMCIPIVASAAPTVTTLSPTYITHNGVHLNGIMSDFTPLVPPDGGFRYSTTPASSCNGMTNFSYVNGLPTYGGAGFYYLERDIVGLLIPNTTYYFCALARVGNQTYYGGVLNFTTLLDPNSGITVGPGGSTFGEVGNVTTNEPATGVTDVEATFHGTVSGVTGSAYAYFRYSTLTTPPIFCNDIFGSNMRSVPAGATGVNYSSGAVTNGSFKAKVINLEPSTTYYYCAVASNHASTPTDIEYGEVKSVTTLPCQTCPHTKIITTSAQVLGPNSANLKGEYGSSKGIATYFEYKKAPVLQQAQEGGGSQGIGTSWTKTPEKLHDANTFGKIISFVTGLSSNTEYMFRAVGKTNDPAETFYGTIKYFKTTTADGFGDGEGWVHNGPLPPTIVISSNPFDPTSPECAQTNNPDAPVQGCDCPPGTVGTYPNCNPQNPAQCPDGYSGFPPNCVLIIPNTCPYGGVYPDCNSIPNSCPYGGVFPDCDSIPNSCPYGGVYPDCNSIPNSCPYGGVFPDCNSIPNTCPFGGVYPNCNSIPNTCAFGGVYPNCNSPTNTADFDGDGVGNGFDSDDDNDGIFDASDVTPLGNGSSQNDLDGDGINNSADTDDDGDGIPDVSDSTPFGTNFNSNDLDGDGVNNELDTDTDGDGIPNASDPDDDNDGLPDHLDRSPRGNGLFAGASSNNQNNQGNNQGGNQGSNQNNQGDPRIGDPTNPPQDAIVRYHEGVETVFIRQIMRSTTLQQKYGYRQGGDLQAFANYLAHFLGRNFGYVAKNRKEVRVRYPDVAAYELREIGTSTTVIESFDTLKNGKFTITGVRKLNSLFKIIFRYEYYFLKRR